MATIERFEDARAWQAARELTQFVYRLTQNESFRSDWGLRSQIQRAAVSGMSNIAEGFERGSTREFIQFLYLAKGSVGEVRLQLYVAQDVGYISQEESKEGLARCLSVSAKINNFIEYLKKFDIQGHKFHESIAEYETGPEGIVFGNLG